MVLCYLTGSTVMSERHLNNRYQNDTKTADKSEVKVQPEFVRQLQILFDILDSDGDGYVEFEELKYYWEKQQPLDRDANNNNETPELSGKFSNGHSESGSKVDPSVHPFKLTLDALGEVCAGHRLVSFQRFYCGVKIAFSTLQGKSGKKPKLRPTSFIYAISNRTFVEECREVAAASDIGIGDAKTSGTNGFTIESRNNRHGNFQKLSIDENPDDLRLKVAQLEQEKAVLVKELFEVRTKNSPEAPPTPF